MMVQGWESPRARFSLSGMPMIASLCAVLLLAPAADADLAATVLAGESRSGALQHQDFRKYAAAGKWDDALTEYNALLARPFDLAPLSPLHSLQGRWLAHRDLALFPTDVRARITDAREALARPALEKALAGIDEVGLRRVVEEQYGSPAAALAADALGDLAFDRGDFAAAGLWYGLLPGTDPARSRAKHLLVRLFAHKRLGPLAATPPALRRDLDAFTRDHAGAAGNLAGRDGTYADMLAAVGRDRALEVPPGDGWPTFAGDAARSRTLPVEEHLADRLAILSRRPFVRVNLDSRRAGAGPDLPIGNRANAGVALYPAIAGGRVYFADARYLTAVDLRTGDVSEVFDAATLLPTAARERTFPYPDYYRASVTVAEGHILARFGAVAVQDERGPMKGPPPESAIVCLRLDPDGAARVAWSAKLSGDPPTLFEGAPLVHQGRAYVAVTRVQGDRTQTAIRCYALDAAGDASPLWSRDVCETPELSGGRVRRLHQLLTLAGPNVVYASHSGAIVALEALTGQRVWARRYRSAPRENRFALPGGEGQPAIHDLAPPLFADGRVFVAPTDSDTTFCLDPWTGTALWQRDGLQPVHLLGTCQDRLVFTTPGGLRAVDALDGGDKTGWALPTDRLPPLGRGQLVGDVVLWPTVRGMRMVRAAEGEFVPGAELGRVPSGNVAYRDGVLAVADRSTLTVYKGEPRPAKADKPPPPEQVGAGLTGTARAEALQAAAVEWQRADAPQNAARLWASLLGEEAVLRDERNRPWPATALALRELAALRDDGAVRDLLDGIGAPTNPLSQAGRHALWEQASHQERDEPLAARTAWRVLLRHGKDSQAAAALRALERTRPADRVPALPAAWALGDAIDLDPGERVVPVAAEPGQASRLVTVAAEVQGGRVTLRVGSTRKPAWRVKLPFVPTWGRVWDELLLFAGAEGLAGVRLDGKVLWQVTSGERYDDFHLAGERLLVRVGTDRLRAVDAPTGAILWEFATGSDPTGPGDLRFVATESRVVVRVPGRAALLDAATGRLLRRDDAEPTDDLRLLDNRRGLLVAERRVVRLLDLATGEAAWSWPVPAVTTSRQEPLRVLPVGGTVWVQVPVNVGHELYRLDARTGKPLAELPRLLRVEPLELSAGRVLGDIVFLVEGTEVVARSTLDAAVRWRQLLPPGPATYRLQVAGDEVLAVPSAVRIAATEFHCLIGTLEWMMEYPPGVPAVASLLRLDATTGKPRTLPVPTGLGRLATAWRPGLQPFLRPEVRSRQRAGTCGLAVLPTPDGWRVVLDDRAWNLRD